MSDENIKDTPIKGERIAKVIARAGVCSRREAEVLVEQGRVSIDGKMVREPGTTVTPAQRVTIDGEALPASEPARLFRFHKPVGVLTTAKDPQGRQTFYDGLPDGLPRLMPVGRLDINSEGLLLLTNDGGLKRHLELPATGWLRRYRVRVYGRVDTRQLDALADGVTVEGVTYGPIQAKLDSQQASNAWLTFALQEGKNREIRQVCRHLGLQVSRLLRVAYGPFQLGALPEGAIDEVPQKALKEQLGAFLAGLGGPAPALEKRKGHGQDPARAAAKLTLQAGKPPAAPRRKREAIPVHRSRPPRDDEEPARRPKRGGWSPTEPAAPERVRGKAKTWGERPAAPQREAEFATARTPGQGRARPGGKPTGGRPAGGKPTGGKPTGGRPSAGKPSGGKPWGDKPSGGRPSGGRPSGKPPGKGPGGARRRG